MGVGDGIFHKTYYRVALGKILKKLKILNNTNFQYFRGLVQ